MLSELARYTVEKYRAVSYKRLYHLLFSKNQTNKTSSSAQFLDLNLDAVCDENGKVQHIELIS
ncbi:MAG: hypothetical protein OEY89_15000 [Gammaproteobacteria bacterium]|nr:hypothetical protein [Gammaproteobacteria bacterium]